MATEKKYLLSEKTKNFIQSDMKTGNPVTIGKKTVINRNTEERMLYITGVVDESPAQGKPYKYLASVYYCQYDNNGNTPEPIATNIELWLEEKAVLTTTADRWYLGKFATDSHFEGLKKKRQ